MIFHHASSSVYNWDGVHCEVRSEAEERVSIIERAKKISNENDGI
jgi:hypothetical protein